MEIRVARLKNLRMKSFFLGLIMVFVLITGCSEQERDTIKIATKPMTEQFILGEMLALLIEEETGMETEITKGIGGGTSNIHPAIVNGDFDLYPEYTATGWFMVLNRTDLPDDEVVFTELQKEYSEKYGLTWVGEYGFNNTYAVAVGKEVADQYGLKTCSDLAKVSDQLIFGANPDYLERPDGYFALCEAYGFNFKSTMEIDIGLRYTALANKKIDVVSAFTTDPQLSTGKLVVLEDDKGYFTNYFAGTVVREDALRKYPGLETALQKMNNILSDSKMVELSYSLEVDHRDEKEIAREFLIEVGLING
jgi:osmoprotectant transport system permease protein